MQGLQAWIAGLVTALAAIFAVSAATAEPARKLQFEFRFYIAGLEAFSLDTTAERDGASYRGLSLSRTAGMADYLIRLNASNRVEGRLTERSLVPTRFVGESDSRLGQRSVTMTWNDRGMVTTVAVPPNEEDDRDPVPDNLLIGALDPLSAALERSLFSAREPCVGRVPIWDGRRRYDIVLETDGEDMLAPTSYSSFAGRAVRCRAKLDRIAGYTKQNEEKAREITSQPSTLWLASYPDQEIVVPVRLITETFWGTIVGHLTFAEADGRTLAPRRAK